MLYSTGMCKTPLNTFEFITRQQYLFCDLAFHPLLQHPKYSNLELLAHIVDDCHLLTAPRLYFLVFLVMADLGITYAILVINHSDPCHRYLTLSSLQALGP